MMGLKSNEVITFLEIIIKASDLQLMKMNEALIAEIEKRNKIRGK